MIAGLVLVAVLAAVAQMAGAVVNPLAAALLLGLGLRFAGLVPAGARPGIRIGARQLMRLAVVLLGLRLTMGQVTGVGAAGIAGVVVLLVATLLVAWRLGRWLGVAPDLTLLIGAGTAICGASAIAAVNGAARARDEDVAYAVACVTLFGSLALIGYPLLAALLRLSPWAYGFWTGASVHEVAQVAAAAFLQGDLAGVTGTVVKMVRVALLAPVMLGLAWMLRRGDAPPLWRSLWFVGGFALLAGLNSLGVVPEPVQTAAASTAGWLMTAALAGVGLEADLRDLGGRGLRPLLLAALTWGFLSGASLILVELLA